MSWQAEISTGSRVTNLRLKVSRFHGWSLPYWQAPLPIASIAEIVSHPEENMGRRLLFPTCAERFPATGREVPCDRRHAAMIHWSSVETTFTYIYIYIYISTPYFILFISRLVFPGHAYRIKLVFQHLLYQNWSWDPHFVVRIPYRHFVGGMFGTYRNLFVGPQNVFSKLEDGVITQ